MAAIEAPSDANEPKLFSLLIPAVGGQGGGVLAEWIVEAALADGLAAHATSIPGVAQRTGSTTYYVEVFSGDGEPPTFSLYPIPGALDVLLAPEFLEVGRSIENGIPSPSRTTIVASTHRLYSIHEKMATGRSLYPLETLEAAARAASRALVAFDALAVAREHESEVNAVLLGALSGSGVLPIRPESFRAAIERKAVSVEANLRGFQAGLASARAPVTLPRPDSPRALRTPPDFAEVLSALPEAVRPIAGEAVARLIDYQSAAYAARYLGRLAPFVERDRDPELARLVAQHLAVWMTYEDAIRVADLKTRASRFARIRADAQARNAEIVVTDYLKPDLDEIYGILPNRLVGPLARWAERRWPHGRPTPGQHVKTTTVLGFLRLWLLARCRWLRPYSYRGQKEHERMDRWLDGVRRGASWDAELGREVARSAQLVKGYGEVRRRMTAVFDHLLASVLRAAALEAASNDGFAVSRDLAAAYRQLVLQGPDAEPRAAALAEDVITRLARGDRSGALAALHASGNGSG